jgi:SAM-dependent methyltransferase
MSDRPYFPEDANETKRLEEKTEKQAVIDQAHWAGLKPGMRVLDVGCGPGLTTSVLAWAAQPGGSAVGIDRSEERIAYAKTKYATANVEFVQSNFFDDHSALGQFDFVWMRFIHEYFLKEAYQLTKHIAQSVKPGGILCLIDLDRNCMNHYGHSERLEKTFRKIGEYQMKNNNFDPFAGSKLQGHLYDVGFVELQSEVRMHHLIYGELSEKDRWNFWQKLEFGAKRSGWTFEDYEEGFAGFEKEFKEYFADKRRFCYTPLIISRGVKPDFDANEETRFFPEDMN